MGILILPLMGIAFYVFLLRPQQQRLKEQQELIRSVAVGDLVITNAGIYGAVAEVEEDIIWLEVAPDVELKLSKAVVAEIIRDDDDSDSDDDDDEDVDDDDFIEADTDEGDA